MGMAVTWGRLNSNTRTESARQASSHKLQLLMQSTSRYYPSTVSRPVLDVGYIPYKLSSVPHILEKRKVPRQGAASYPTNFARPFTPHSSDDARQSIFEKNSQLVPYKKLEFVKSASLQYPITPGICMYSTLQKPRWKTVVAKDSTAL